MTTAADLQLPPITCPSSLIASCPPLLGFQPESSLICLVHSPGSTRPVVARVDVVPDDHAQPCAVELAATLTRTGGSQATVVLWIDAPDDAQRADLPGVCMVEHLDVQLAQRGIAIDLAVATNGRVWWPLLCRDDSCCSGQARPVDAEVAGRVQVEYAVAGFAPLPARSELARRLNRDPLGAMRTRKYLAEAPKASASFATRQRQVNRLWQALRPGGAATEAAGPCDPVRDQQHHQRVGPLWPQRPPRARAQSVASPQSAIRALEDVGIRDALLVRFAHETTTCRTCWQHSIAVLVDVVRAAPPGYLAPSATLLALVSWLSGDGALATVAIQRALDDSPSYRLAGLVRELIGSGLDPQTWRTSAVGLTEEQCLRKTRPSQGARR